MFIEVLNSITNFNEASVELIENGLKYLHLPEVFLEPTAESIILIPFLFVIFVFIEIFENYFSERIEHFSRYSAKYGAIIGALLASIPQCGFSVIATMLYVERFITLGTLIAVYLATSDEAIPVLLMYPDKFPVILPVIAIKVGIAIVVGHLIDLIIKPELKKAPEKIEIDETGCCHNKIQSQVQNLLIHPLKHTFNIFLFILLINCVLGYSLTMASGGITALFTANKYLQVIMASFVGLIPNCAISVLVVMLYIKSALSFGALISGLSTNAGLGILILFKNNESIKDSLRIVCILLVTSIVVGFLIQLFNFTI